MVVVECIGRVHRQSGCAEWYVGWCVERRAKRCAQFWSFTEQPVDLCAPGVWGIQASGGMAPTRGPRSIRVRLWLVWQVLGVNNSDLGMVPGHSFRPTQYLSACMH